MGFTAFHLAPVSLLIPPISPLSSNPCPSFLEGLVTDRYCLVRFLYNHYNSRITIGRQGKGDVCAGGGPQKSDGFIREVLREGALSEVLVHPSCHRGLAVEGQPTVPRVAPHEQTCRGYWLDG